MGTKGNFIEDEKFDGAGHSDLDRRRFFEKMNQ